MAMKEGQAESRDLQVLLLGAENTGKTCLVSSFFSEEFVEGQVSTNGADIEVCKIYCKEWTRVSHSDKENHLQYQFVNQCKCDAIKKMSPTISRKESLVFMNKDTPTITAQIELPDIGLNRIQDIVQGDSPKTADYDPESLNVTLWDFAGQVIFHNTHSVFISEEGVPIITFDASVELTSEINLRDNSSPLQEKSTGISGIHYWLQVVDILLCFHLIACITKEAFFSEEGCPSLPACGDVFIVPSLIPRDKAKVPPSTKRERIIYFMFKNGFVPVSLLNQLIAYCICRNVQRNDRLLW